MSDFLIRPVCEKTCVIMQPTYLPWLGYFDLIASADVFVFLDHVQYSKQSWQQRNKIRDKNGEQLLTLNVKRAPVKEHRISEVLIDHNKKPLVKHLKSIKGMYAKSRNFNEVFIKLEEIYSGEHTYLSDFNIELIRYGMSEMDITTETIRSSSLQVSGPRVEGIVEICRKLGCNRYLSPVGSQKYIDQNNIFKQQGITLKYQSYEHIVYKQIAYPDFISHLSFIDYLFNREQ